MNNLSHGFMEALENDLAHAIEGLSIHTGLDSHDKSLAPLGDWTEVIREHNSRGAPRIPSSDFRLPRVKSATPQDQANYQKGSSLDGGSSVTGSISRTMPQKKSKRSYDIASFVTDDWTLAKGWKNRPRAGKKFGDSVKKRDIEAFKMRLMTARARGDGKKGARFGNPTSTGTSFQQSLTGHSLSESSSDRSITRGSVLSNASRYQDVSFVSSLAGATKVEHVLFAYKHDTSTMGEKYNPSDVQEIMHRNLVDMKRGEMGSRLSSPAGSRTSQNKKPILVPRAGSPLEKGRTVTFGYCRRFSYDPTVGKPKAPSAIPRRLLANHW